MNKDLMRAAVNAHNVITAVYEWVDRVEKAGGTTSISGIAACNSMLKSLRAQQPRLDKLVTEPLLAAIEAAKK